MASRAIFLDRDGTLVWPREYPSTPQQLVLYEGVGPELRVLQRHGFRLVVVTNQSGVAHGYFTAEALAQMHHHLARELARFDVHLDGIYFCPHHPEGVIPEFRRHCDCRKPQPGMLLAAAADLALDLSRSWMIGDILGDIEAGKRAGCRTVLIDLGTERAPSSSLRRPDFVVTNTVEASRLIRAIEGCGLPIENRYWPARWSRALDQDGHTSRSPGESSAGRHPLADALAESAQPGGRTRCSLFEHDGEEAR